MALSGRLMENVFIVFSILVSRCAYHVLRAVGYKVYPVGYTFFVPGCKGLPASYQVLGVGYKVLPTGYRFFAIGYHVLPVGYGNWALNTCNRF